MGDKGSNRVIIFGNGRFSMLAWYVLSHDSSYQVAAFTVDGEYLTGDQMLGLPVLPFEEIEQRMSPDDYLMLAPLGYRRVNRLRGERYRQGKDKGYRFISYVSSKASLWPDLEIGENCMIYEQAVVEPFAKIGDNVIVRSGVHLSHHVRVGNHCFLSAHAVAGGEVTIGEYSFVGLNATLRNGIDIAPDCVIAAGAVVTGDTKANGVYMGVPARRQAVPASEMQSF